MGFFGPRTTAAAAITSINAPTDLSDLYLWFDADDSSSVLNAVSPDTAATNNQSVRRWKDKSGKNDHANQTTANNQPTYKTNQINGKAVVEFDGSNDFFTFGGDSGSVYSMFFVIKRATNSIISIVLGGSSGSCLLPYIATGRDTYFARSGAVTNVRSTTETGAMLLSVRRGKGETEKAYFNGTEITTSPANTETPSVNLGSDRLGFGSGVYHSGQIAEVVCYSRFLPTTEFDAVRNYLNTKWAIY